MTAAQKLAATQEAEAIRRPDKGQKAKATPEPAQRAAPQSRGPQPQQKMAQLGQIAPKRSPLPKPVEEAAAAAAAALKDIPQSPVQSQPAAQAGQKPKQKSGQKGTPRTGAGAETPPSKDSSAKSSRTASPAPIDEAASAGQSGPPAGSGATAAAPGASGGGAGAAPAAAPAAVPESGWKAALTQTPVRAPSPKPPLPSGGAPQQQGPSRGPSPGPRVSSPAPRVSSPAPRVPSPNPAAAGAPPAAQGSEESGFAAVQRGPKRGPPPGMPMPPHLAGPPQQEIVFGNFDSPPLAVPQPGGAFPATPPGTAAQALPAQQPGGAAAAPEPAGAARAVIGVELEPFLRPEPYVSTLQPGPPAALGFAPRQGPSQGTGPWGAQLGAPPVAVPTGVWGRPPPPGVFSGPLAPTPGSIPHAQLQPPSAGQPRPPPPPPPQQQAPSMLSLAEVEARQAEAASKAAEAAAQAVALALERQPPPLPQGPSVEELERKMLAASSGPSPSPQPQSLPVVYTATAPSREGKAGQFMLSAKSVVLLHLKGMDHSLVC